MLERDNFFSPESNACAPRRHTYTCSCTNKRLPREKVTWRHGCKKRKGADVESREKRKESPEERNGRAPPRRSSFCTRRKESEG